jgi:hypothetical protein
MQSVHEETHTHAPPPKIPLHLPWTFINWLCKFEGGGKKNLWKMIQLEEVGLDKVAKESTFFKKNKQLELPSNQCWCCNHQNQLQLSRIVHEMNNLSLKHGRSF